MPVKKAAKAPPSGRALMSPQQKKDADIANMGARAALKAATAPTGEATGPKPDLDAIRAEAARQRSIAQGAVDKTKPKPTGKQDLSFLDASLGAQKKK